MNDELIAMKKPKKPITTETTVQTVRVKIEPIDTEAPWIKFDANLKKRVNGI